MKSNQHITNMIMIMCIAHANASYSMNNETAKKPNKSLAIVTYAIVTTSNDQDNNNNSDNIESEKDGRLDSPKHDIVTQNKPVYVDFPGATNAYAVKNDTHNRLQSNNSVKNYFPGSNYQD